MPGNLLLCDLASRNRLVLALKLNESGPYPDHIGKTGFAAEISVNRYDVDYDAVPVNQGKFASARNNPANAITPLVNRYSVPMAGVTISHLVGMNRIPTDAEYWNLYRWLQRELQAEHGFEDLWPDLLV